MSIGAAQTARPEPALAVNGVVADFAAEVLRDRSGAVVALRPQAFAVLRHLAANPDRLVTKAELMAAVWPGVAVTDDSLVQCIHDIRCAIGDEAHAVLRTVPRRGYRLVLPADGAVAAPGRRGRWLAAGVVALLAVGAAGAWWRVGDNETGPLLAGPPVVAVRSFINIAGDEASERIALGLRKDFLTDLARFREFQIVLRSSTYLYDEEPPNAPDVDFVLGGAIHHEGDELRITVQLFDAATGNLLWSQRWDYTGDDVLSVQSEISEQIANRLGGGAGVIQQSARAAAHRGPPDTLTAYQLYVLGTESRELGTPAEVAQAVRLLARAVELEPGLARAWAELSLAYDAIADFGIELEANRSAAGQAAERAVALNPLDAKARVALGTSLGNRNNFGRARSEIETALALAPNAAEVLALSSRWASTFGEPELGVAAVDRVTRLTPDLPTWAAGPFAHAYFMAGRYEAALGMIDRLKPEAYSLAVWAMRPAALAAVGRQDEAVEWVAKAVEAMPEISIETMANAPGYSEDGHQRFVETMRAAGFPPCAAPEVLAKITNPTRLPECAARADARPPAPDR